MFAQLGICCAVFWVVGKVYLWALLLSEEEPMQRHWAGIAVAILCVISIGTGVMAVVLRFTERPRETFVQDAADDFKPPFEPPVIHARHE